MFGLAGRPGPPYLIRVHREVRLCWSSNAIIAQIKTPAQHKRNDLGTLSFHHEEKYFILKSRVCNVSLSV